MTDRIWILGAPDPEMATIEALLVECGQTVGYAMSASGSRVHSGNAYRSVGFTVNGEFATRWYGDAVTIECGGDLPPQAASVDHHRPGDPGFGRSPSEFMSASSLGQVISLLGQVADYPDSWERVSVARHPHWCGSIERIGGDWVARTTTRDCDPGQGAHEATAAVIPRDIVLAAWLLVPALLADDKSLVDKPASLAGKAVRMAIAVDDAISTAATGASQTDMLRKTIADQRIEIRNLLESLRRQDEKS